MIRVSALLAIAVMTACGAPEVRTEGTVTSTPAEEPVTSTSKGPLTRSEASRGTNAVSCDDSLETDRMPASYPGDADFWIEALVFGASDGPQARKTPTPGRASATEDGCHVSLFQNSVLRQESTDAGPSPAGMRALQNRE